MESVRILILRLALAAVLAFRFEAMGQQTAFEQTGGSASELFGSVVVRIHDFDHDGVEDLAVGAPGFDPTVLLTNAGRIYVVSGKSGAFLGFVNGGSALEKFGTSIVRIDDVTGDGVPDIAAGAPGFGGGNPTGAIRIVDGANLSPIGLIAGPSAGARIGERLVALTDLNGNGVKEIATGARGLSIGLTPNVGAVLILDPASGATIAQFNGLAAFDAFGTGLGLVKDFSGDGVPELVIGAPGADPLGNNGAGMVQVVDPVTGNVLSQFNGLAASDSLGATCDGLSDIDGDQFPEIVAGATGATVNGIPLAGSVFVYSTGASQVLARIDGTSANDQFGSTLSGLLDIDGDGFDDFAAGSPNWTKPGVAAAVGRVIVFSGRTQSLLYDFAGSSGGVEFGAFVGPLGDLNGDHRRDFVIGWPSFDPVATDAGQISVRLGSTPTCDITTTGQYGSPITFRLQGTPGQFAFVMLDVAPGYFPTVYGKLYLGLTAAFGVFALGNVPLGGSLVIATTLPPAGPPSATVYLQSAITDPNAMGGAWFGGHTTLNMHP